MDKVNIELLRQISDLHDIPDVGIFNIRQNGKLLVRKTDDEIDIVSKTNKDGIDVLIKENTKDKKLDIPVLLSEEGFKDKVYNDFFIGNKSEVVIVAGCGIHNCSNKISSHRGIHTFHIGDDCVVKYVEKHLGLGNYVSDKILNPLTKIEMGKNSTFVMETIQLGGVTSTERKTKAVVGENSTLTITEKIFTDHSDFAKTVFDVVLKGENSKTEVVSRSVAKGKSKQIFISNITGKGKCFGHVECDGLLSNKAQISSAPNILALSPEATLIHEAAIGKISQEQQNKLMTLGLTKDEAEKCIINGFLK
ncbi:MAG: SufD family Fe-S cluster assembly protein [Clostridia bacterium]|nr:SufD family Fe-S cluster assembly protein [Clostridia bacterium]